MTGIAKPAAFDSGGRLTAERIRRTRPYRYTLLLRVVAGVPLLGIGLAHVFAPEAPMRPLVEAAGIPFAAVVGAADRASGRRGCVRRPRPVEGRRTLECRPPSRPSRNPIHDRLIRLVSSQAGNAVWALAQVRTALQRAMAPSVAAG